jgi:hypothetical protein
MAGVGAGPRFEVRVVDEILADDLAHCTRAARAAIESVLATVREKGVPYEWLLRCQEEARDGTRLGGCVKFYIPRPAGPWGAVLAGDEEDGSPSWCCSPSVSGILTAVGNPASTRSPTVA